MARELGETLVSRPLDEPRAFGRLLGCVYGQVCLDKGRRSHG